MLSFLYHLRAFYHGFVHGDGTGKDNGGDVVCDADGYDDCGDGNDAHTDDYDDGDGAYDGDYGDNEEDGDDVDDDDGGDDNWDDIACDDDGMKMKHTLVVMTVVIYMPVSVFLYQLPPHGFWDWRGISNRNHK